MPLPSPRITGVASRDRRELAWLLWSRAGERVVRDAAGRPLCRDDSCAEDGWSLYTFAGTPHAAIAVVDQLRLGGDDPSWARDLR